MKQVIVIVIILLTAAPMTFAQTKGKKTNLNVRAEQELIQIENELIDALLKRDVSVFERFLDEDYIFTDSGSNVHFKANVLGYLKSGDLINETYFLSDLRVRLYGNTAIVTGRSKTKWRAGDDGAIDQDRFTDVFVKRNERWYLVAGQTTRISREQQSVKK
jgi:ketosteroid isomerase-like protein